MIDRTHTLYEKLKKDNIEMSERIRDLEAECDSMEERIAALESCYDYEWDEDEEDLEEEDEFYRNLKPNVDFDTDPDSN